MQVEVCLFDKTGTLTTDQLVCTGTVSFSAGKKGVDADAPRAIQPLASTSWEMCVVMGACHALVQVQLSPHVCWVRYLYVWVVVRCRTPTAQNTKLSNRKGRGINLLQQCLSEHTVLL